MTPNAWTVLEATSRTFYAPIIQLPTDLKESVASAYLCMRAIDQIEDHETLSSQDKVHVLEKLSDILGNAGSSFPEDRIRELFEPKAASLEQVTLNLPTYAQMGSPEVAPLVWRYTADMAQSMAKWVQAEWTISSEADLRSYTFDVAGRVGLLLNRLWHWYDGTEADDDYAVGFGRGLQAVNILRNREEDAERGVSFYPPGWKRAEMIAFIRKELSLAQRYLDELPPGPAHRFCIMPFKLASATVEAIEGGREKLSRADVLRIVATCATSTKAS